MNTVTNDQAFKDAVIKAIKATIEQGSGSYRLSGEGPIRCMYRSPDGKKCILGQLIKDKYYSRKIEGCSVRDKSLTQVLNSSLGFDIDEEQKGILGFLQYCHDRACDWENLGESFVEEFKRTTAHKIDSGDLPEYCKCW